MSEKDIFLEENKRGEWGSAVVAGRFIRKLQGVIDDLKYIQDPAEGKPLLQGTNIEMSTLPDIIEKLARPARPRHCTTLNYTKLKAPRADDKDVDIGFCGESGERFLKDDWFDIVVNNAKTIPNEEKQAMRHRLRSGCECELPGLTSRRSRAVSVKEFEDVLSPYFPEGGVIYCLAGGGIGGGG